MTTPLAITPARAAKSTYGKKTLQIIVGTEKEPFHVHISHLERTAFFEVHGRPLMATLGSPTRTASTVRDGTASPVPVNLKLENSDEATGLDNENNQQIDAVATPVYHLEGLGYEPGAFEVVVDWLYNQPPEFPKTRSACRTLLRSYVLALRYQIVELQDCIVDSVRNYHREFTVVFEDLVWIINRIGESEAIHNIPMVKYLIDQCAWEIHVQGYRSFVLHNPLFEPFLAMGDRPIRKVLFEAMAEVSRESRIDPAAGPNRYRVVDCVPQQHITRADQIIEHDD
jgi:hypothetical protein